MTNLVTRIFGSYCIVLGLILLAYGSWSNVEKEWVTQSYNIATETRLKLEKIPNKTVQLKNPSDISSFQKDLYDFQLNLTTYKNQHISARPLLPYLFCTTMIIAAILYILSGIGILYHKTWSYIFFSFGAGLYLISFCYMLFSMFLHLNFLNDIIINIQKLISYTTINTNLLQEIPTLNQYIPLLIAIPLIVLIIFIALPFWFFNKIKNESS